VLSHRLALCKRACSAGVRVALPRAGAGHRTLLLAHPGHWGLPGVGAPAFTALFPLPDLWRKDAETLSVMSLP